MSDDPFCVDCKWIAPPRKSSIDPACDNPLNRVLDLVSGKKVEWTPSWLRSPAGEHLCGPHGKWFEAKGVKQ